MAETDSREEVTALVEVTAFCCHSFNGTMVTTIQTHRETIMSWETRCSVGTEPGEEKERSLPKWINGNCDEMYVKFDKIMCSAKTGCNE